MPRRRIHRPGRPRRSSPRRDRSWRWGYSAFHDRTIAAAWVALLQFCPNRSGGTVALIEATAASNRRTTSRAVDAKAIPAAVRVRWCVERSTSWTARLRSSWARVRDRAGCERCNCTAARVMVPSSAIARKQRRWRSSMVIRQEHNHATIGISQRPSAPSHCAREQNPPGRRVDRVGPARRGNRRVVVRAGRSARNGAAPPGHRRRRPRGHRQATSVGTHQPGLVDGMRLRARPGVDERLLLRGGRSAAARHRRDHRAVRPARARGIVVANRARCRTWSWP